MATPIKRIEKDFLLKVLYDNQIPLMYLCDRTEYILRVVRPVKNEVFFKSDRPIASLKPKQKIELMFDYKGQIIIFTVEVMTIKEDNITAPVPEFLFKNLDRSYSRVNIPDDLNIKFTFHGDRYFLPYPKTHEFIAEDIGEWKNNTDLKDVKKLIGQMAAWVKGCASGYKMVIFKNVKPASIEELLITDTGKCLFLPSTTISFLQEDQYPEKRLITEEIFSRYLEKTGVDCMYTESTISRFVKQKVEAGYFSDVWAPILFHEYVIGYIRIWINQNGKLPFDYNLVETVYQYAKVFAYSLKETGYFNSGRIKNGPFEGKIIDISASGLLFSYPHSPLSGTLVPNSELVVHLSAPNRNIRTIAKIVRHYKDNTRGYFGCRFIDMAPEDMRFLFEHIYGKTFTGADASVVAGKA
ncbi:MAG: PilZ domain-containing protein [Treponema sp.]|jgi:c-di-GMP-binding flagellar brake protein YcgR|nr:PilZ domain-containing protein [Treponema sp.]